MRHADSKRMRAVAYPLSQKPRAICGKPHVLTAGRRACSPVPLALMSVVLGGVLGWAVCPASRCQAAPAEAPASAELDSAGGEGAPGDERATAFRAVKGPSQQDVPGGVLLLGAYGAIWLLLLAFTLHLARLQRQGQQELTQLRALVDGRAEQKRTALVDTGSSDDG